MTRELKVVVYGTPASQGSKKPFRNKYTGRIQQVESSDKVAPWRADVRAAVEVEVERIDWQRIDDGPILVNIEFAFERPKGHFGTGRNAGHLRYRAPLAPAVKPDLDKLVRGVLDALGSTGLVWRDDAQVTSITTRKDYTFPVMQGQLDRPGATITVWQSL